jgi:hypothetical protein
MSCINRSTSYWPRSEFRDFGIATQPPPLPSEEDHLGGQRIWKILSVPPPSSLILRLVITSVDLLHMGARSDDGQIQFLVHLIIASSSHEVNMAEAHAVVHESEMR